MSKGCSFFKSLPSTLPTHRRTFRHKEIENSPKGEVPKPPLINACKRNPVGVRPHVFFMLCVLGQGCRGGVQVWSYKTVLFLPEPWPLSNFPYLHTRLGFLESIS